MNENVVEKNNAVEIDLQRLFGAIWQKLWLIIIVAILCASIALAGTYYFITPLYESSAMFYVNNSSLSVGDTSFSISQGDIVASQYLVDSYIVILNTRESLIDVIDYSGVDRTYSELRNMISASAVNETEIFRVVVTSPDPEEADQIADAIAYILPKRIASIIEGTSAAVVDSAVVASSPSSPSYTKNTVLGFMIGVILSAGIIILRELLDVSIREEEDIAITCKHPILATVPDMTASTKGGNYYYGYGNKKKKADKAGHVGKKQTVLVGNGISFAASEAYKLLRTKLQFSFADENNSRVIGVSSALSGEGKSLSAINLAYTLSQLNKRVLLIECDMRRPSLSKKIPIQRMPGLSNHLTGQSYIEPLIQKCGLEKDEDAFDVVSSGRTPPNPIELLSSAKMGKMLNRLKESYDYIILDLPPVGEVSDALAVAKLTDGMLLVVRQNYCNRVVLGATIRQFEFVDSKILGVVYNCTYEHSGKYGNGYYRKYGRYGKYGKYGKKYYDTSYENAAHVYEAKVNKRAAKLAQNAETDMSSNGDE